MGTVEDTSSDGEPTGRNRGGGVSEEQLEELVGDDGDEELSLDEVFDLLRNQRRRRVLRYLDADADGTATLDELAEHIASKENDVPIQQLTSSQRKRVYIGLYQCHLPKLDELGVVDYDQSRGTIGLRDISRIEPYLEGPKEEQKEDDASLALLSGVGLVVLVVLVGLLGIGPLSVAPSSMWALISIAALVVVTAIQYR